LPSIEEVLSQVIQMILGDQGKPLVLCLPKDLTGLLTQLLDRRTTGCVIPEGPHFVAFIHRRQQVCIRLGVLLFKTG